MIQRFRRKFIAVATVAIFLLLAAILGTINIVNFTVLAGNADQVTSLLAAEGGQFNEPGPFGPIPGEGEPGFAPSEGGQPFDPISPETRMSTRYFTVKVDAAGTATMVKMSFTERTVTPEEALTWGASLAKPGSFGWTRTYYRYRAYNYDNHVYVSVIDYSRELSPSYRVLWASIVGSLVGVFISFLVLIPVSKVLVKPLETSVKKQQRFISDASHELKTPLTIISANNELIELEHGPSESTDAIDKQVSRLTVMVRNLNTLARLDEGEKQVYGEVDLSALANEVISPFEATFAGKNIKFTTEIPDGMTLKGDQEELRKLLSILMDNAQKYALSSVEFHLYRAGERTAIKVINDAEGIEEGSLDRVFERFYRSDNARASNVEGSGLGLSIAKQIVFAHGGRIMAKGENGKFIIKAEF